MPEQNTVSIPGTKPEGIPLGMNTRDGGKALRPGEGLLLQNGYPAKIAKPRYGMVDLSSSTTALGYGTTASYFRRDALRVKTSTHDWFWAWAHSGTDLTEYHLEQWRTGVRNAQMYLDMPNEQEYFGLENLYDALYVTMEHEATTNHTYPVLTKNMIIEHDGSAWVPRAMMIDEAPIIGAIGQVDSEPTPFPGPRYGASVSFEGAFWIIGGDFGDDRAPYVWKSTDGEKWSLVTNNAGFGRRYLHACVVYDNKMWLICGSKNGTPTADVWYSSDGATWTEATSSAACGALYGHTAVVYDGFMWVIGGNKSAADTDHVYKSSDGITWTQVTVTNSYTARKYHRSLVYNNLMWVIAGEVSAAANDDVYSSPDGAVWTLTAGTPGFAARLSHSAAVFAGRMWVAAGWLSSGPTVRADDVWSSRDGVTWTEETADAGYSDCQGAIMGVIAGQLYLIGGEAAAVITQSYRTSDGVTWAKVVQGIETDKYANYAITFVRRTDSDSKLSGITAFQFRNWRTYEGRTIVDVDEKLLTGTVSLSGTALTGVDTNFDGEIEAGDYIRINGTPFSYEVSSVTDDTNAVVVNAFSHSYTTKEFSLLPAVGDAIATDVFNTAVAEGIEDSDYQQIIFMDPPTSGLGAAMPVIPMPQNAADAATKGATHMRVFRSEASTVKATAKGTVLKYVVDIPITGDTYVSTDYYFDSLNDTSLHGETHQLEVTGYEPPPQCRYLFWDSNTGRLWAFGDPDNEGYGYCSKTPSDSANPQKYASWFDLDRLFVTCGPRNREKATGVTSLGGDLYFFKEQSIYRLANGEISGNKPVKICNFGCPFPKTITHCNIPRLRGFCILFLSDIGPAILLPGGRVELFYGFAIGELWPGGGLLEESQNHSLLSWDQRNKVTACFWNNSFFIFYGDSETEAYAPLNVAKTYGYHFGQAEDEHGAFEFTFPECADAGHGTYVVYEPLMLMPIDNVEAYTLSHRTDDDNLRRYRLTRFLKPGSYQDAFHS